MAYVKVKDANYVRDTNSMALFNSDPAVRTDYQSKMNMILRQKNELNTVRKEIDDIKSDVSDIKDLLIKLLDK